MFAYFRRVLRSNRSFYRMFRQLRNRYHCWRYGLRNVHPTTYVMWGSHISLDLIAHEYGYIAPGCTIGPKVELGQYVLLAPQVTVIGADHRFDLPGVPIIFAGRPELPPVRSSPRAFRPTRSGAGFRLGESKHALQMRSSGRRTIGCLPSCHERVIIVNSVSRGGPRM